MTTTHPYGTIAYYVEQFRTYDPGLIESAVAGAVEGAVCVGASDTALARYVRNAMSAASIVRGEHAEARLQAAGDGDTDREHCFNCGGTYDEETGEHDDDGECVHCACCCTCLACEYGPRDGMLLTAEQRAPAAAFLVDHGPVKPPYGSPERATHDAGAGS